MFPLRNWLKKTFRSPVALKKPQCRQGANKFHPRLEEFEARVVPSTVTVTSNTDDPTDTGSLRYILNHATSGETIDFAASVRTITLSTQSGANTTGLLLGTNVTIINDQGSGPVTIDGGGATTGFSDFTVNSGVTASISGLTITDGKVTGTNSGGGIYNGGTLTVSSSTFSYDSADADGGGIYNGGTLTVSSSTFSNNSTDADGGGIYNGGTLTVSSSTFSNSFAISDGGGIYNGGTLTVSNSTFCNNSGRTGGGIDNNRTLIVSDSTLFNNSARVYGGGGIFNASMTTLNGDILVGNNANGRANDLDGNGMDSSENLVGVDPTGSLQNSQNGNQVNVSVAQAGLAPLGYYGGLTQTFALLPGSFAIGKGLTATTATTDQRGIPRPIDTPSDVGAFQLTAPPTVTTNPSSQTIVVPATSNVSFSGAATETYPDGSTIATTVQWQLSTDGGNTFSNLTNDGTYSGVTTGTLNIAGATTALSGTEYRAVFTNPLGQTTTTSAATLTVNEAPTVTGNPVNQSIIGGGSTSFSATASDGKPTPTFVQWQVSTDGGVTFSNIVPSSIYSGVNTPMLTITKATATLNGDEYRGVFSNAANLMAATTAATLTVDVPPTITGTTAGQAIDDNAIIKPFQSVSLADPDSATETHTVTVTLSSNANGTLSNLGGGTYDAATGVFTLNNVTLSQAQSALQALVFTPTAHQVLPGQTVATGFSLSISDDGGAATDNTTSVVTTDTLTNLGVVVSSGASVEIFTRSGKLFETLTPFGRGTTVASLTTGDVTGDGVPDIIVSTARGGGQIKVYDGITGQLVKTFTPYGAKYTAGVNVAVGDILGNGHEDLIVAPGGANGRVEVIDPATGAVLASFYPFSQKYPTHAYTGGVRVAAGNLSGTGQAEVIVGTAAPQSGYAEVWKHSGAKMVPTGQHVSLASQGVFLSTGTFTPGGHADLIVGSQTVSGPKARLVVLDGESFKVVASLPTSSPAVPVFSDGNRQAVRVAVRDVTGDGVPDVVVATGAGLTQEVRVFDFTGSSLVLDETLTASDLDLQSTMGLYVA
jgi:hypothetical protein